jgi:uncharacterized protein YidB (DUF937 family)
MSGILGQVLGGLMGGGGQGSQQSPMAMILQQILVSGGSQGGQAGQGGQGGGINALVSRFEQAGLGPQAQSWVSSGQNQPISGDQIGQVFSADQIKSWADQAGTSPDKLKDVLAQALPHAVDHVTPDGQVPQSGNIAGMLAGLLGGAGTPPQRG